MKVWDAELNRIWNEGRSKPIGKGWTAGRIPAEVLDQYDLLIATQDGVAVSASMPGLWSAADAPSSSRRQLGGASGSVLRLARSHSR